MQGKRRVIIENVQPLVDGGLYPAKRTVGETVQVSASIFGDGHDHLRASVLFKKKGASRWSTVEMRPTFNDEWAASFKVEEKGTYVFTIDAWVDHFETWYDGFKKKAAAKVDVKVELMEGAAFLRTLANNGLANLMNLASKLENTDKHAEAIQVVLSNEFEQIVHDYPLKENETRYSTELEIRVEHNKANFSAWYEFFPRSSSLEAGKHGTFQDCIKLLPRVAAMGFDVLYFPPIHPIGKINRKGRNNNVRSEKGEPGSPWAIG
ncbi:MAG: maltotransferase domain-containing protein, partial [Bacteroidota bacterium]